jgi:hypothetical protein
MAAMKYDEQEETYTLASGRRIYASGGVLGLAPADTMNVRRAEVYGGYDGSCLPLNDDDPYDDHHDLTPDERREIAAEMIHRWFKWSEG